MSKLGGLLLFVGGAAVGLFVGYAVTKKKYEDILEDEIYTMRESMRNREAMRSRRDKTENEEAPEEAIRDAEVNEEIEPTEEELEYRKKARIRYNEIIKQRNYDNKVAASRKLHDCQEPHLISNRAYNYECTDYDKLDWTFYGGDEVITDENDDPVEDSCNILGPVNNNTFGDEENLSGDPDLIYIRNDKLRIDYEIARFDGSYGAKVGGDSDEAME